MENVKKLTYVSPSAVAVEVYAAGSILIGSGIEGNKPDYGDAIEDTWGTLAI